MTLPLPTTTTTVLQCDSNSSFVEMIMDHGDENSTSPIDMSSAVFVLVDDNARSHSPPPAFLRQRQKQTQDDQSSSPEFFQDSFSLSECDLLEDHLDESDEHLDHDHDYVGDGSSSTLLSFASYQNSFNSSCNFDTSSSTITVAASNVTKKKKYEAPSPTPTSPYHSTQMEVDDHEEEGDMAVSTSPEHSDLDHTRHTSTSRWATDVSSSGGGTGTATVAGTAPCAVPQRRSSTTTTPCCSRAPPTLPCRSHSPQQPNARRKTRPLATKDNPLRMIRRKNSTDLPCIHRVFPATRSSSGSTGGGGATSSSATTRLDTIPKRRFVSSKSA